MSGVADADARVLRAIVVGVEAATGEEFFRSLVRHLASALAVQYAFVSEFTADRRAFRTLALWGRGAFMPNLEIPLAGTPCETVLNGEMSHHPERLQALFPADTGLVDWRAESYCGTPLIDPTGAVVGHLAIIDDRPMPDGERALSVMRIFAARVVAEVGRLRAEAALRDGEARYRDLYEEAPVAYYSIDTEGYIRRFNRRFCQLFGYPPEALHGRSIFDIYADTPSGKPRARGASRTSARASRPSARRSSAGARTVARCGSLSVRPMRDAEGRVVATRSMIVDLTERRRMEAELAASESRYRDLYTQAPAAYMSFGRDGRLIHWNKRAEELTGYAGDELRGVHFSALGGDSAAGKPQQAKLYEQFLAGVETVSEPRARGRTAAASGCARTCARSNADGEICATQSILIDITDRKRAEQALRASESASRASSARRWTRSSRSTRRAASSSSTTRRRRSSAAPPPRRSGSRSTASSPTSSGGRSPARRTNRGRTCGRRRAWRRGAPTAASSPPRRRSRRSRSAAGASTRSSCATSTRGSGPRRSSTSSIGRTLPPGGDQVGPQLRGDHRAEPRPPGGAEEGRPRRRDRFLGADPRRDRHGEGAVARAVHSNSQRKDHRSSR
jgi:PAS domain S-box-containing protein